LRLTVKPLGNLDHQILCDLKTGKLIRVIKGRKTLEVLVDECADFVADRDSMTVSKRTELKTRYRAQIKRP